MLYESQIYCGKGIFKGMKLLIAHSQFYIFSPLLLFFTITSLNLYYSIQNSITLWLDGIKFSFKLDSKKFLKPNLLN